VSVDISTSFLDFVAKYLQRQRNSPKLIYPHLPLQFSAYLASPTGPIRQHTPPHLDEDAYIELLLVVAGHRTKLEMEHIPDVFMPETGEHAIRG